MKKQIVLFSFLLIFIFSSLTTATNKALITENDDIPLMLTPQKDVIYVRSNIQIDDHNRIHTIYSIAYENGTVVLLHQVGNNLTEIHVYFYEHVTIDELIAIPDGIAFAFTSQEGYENQNIFLYTWQGGLFNTELIDTISVYYVDIRAFSDEEAIHILYSNKVRYGEDLYIKHFQYFYANGSSSSEIYETSFQTSYLRDLYWNNGSLYLSFQYWERFDNGTKENYLILNRVGKNSYENITNIAYSTYWNQDWLKFSGKGIFELVIFYNGNLYTKRYTTDGEINETHHFATFTHIPLDIYYLDYLYVISYESVSYYVYKQSYYYYEEVTYIDSEYSETAVVTAITLENNRVIEESIELGNAKDDYSIFSYYPYYFENGSYIFAYTTRADSKDFKNLILNEDEIISFNLYSSFSLNVLESPILYDLKSLTPFQYFIKKYWAAIVFPVAVLAILYGIFRKKVNKSLRKLKNYLIRPIKPDKSITQLIIINLGLFIVNSSQIIFVLWKANKKRLVISILGLTILATIIISSTTLYDSKRSAMILQFTDNLDLQNSGDPSLEYNIFFDSSGVGGSLLNENLSRYAINEIMYRINSNTTYLSKIISNYFHSLSTNVVLSNITEDGIAYSSTYMGLQSNYSYLMSSLLDEGRLPNQKNEIIATQYTLDNFNIGIDDYVKINGSIDSSLNTSEHTVLKVVGVYTTPSYAKLMTLCQELNVSYDVVTNLVWKLSSPIITFDDYYFDNLENLTNYNLSLHGFIQFVYDFSGQTGDFIENVVDECKQLSSSSPYLFTFTSNAMWYFGSELNYVFNYLDIIMQQTQLMMVLLAIPIIYLAWFLLFEVNELFGSSFKQEIRILRSKGASTGNITFIYTTMKIIESIIAIFASFGIMVLILPVILKVDKFLSFNAQFSSMNFQTLPASMGISFSFLILLSIPKVIQLSKQKKTIVKPPRKFIQVVKNFRLHYLFLIVIGAVLFFGSFYLIAYFVYMIPDQEQAMRIIMIFTYLMGIGVMIALLGFGLILKEIHKVIMLYSSKIAWKTKKSVFSFSLVDVRSDINLFNNTFLTYIILIWILVPSIVIPLTIQNRVSTDARFYSGSDIHIRGWGNLNSSIINNITSYSEVESVTNISVYSCFYGTRELDILVINDTSDFLDTVFKPSKEHFTEWEESVQQIEQNKTMMVSDAFSKVIARGSQEYTFVYTVNYTLISLKYNISKIFNYFPIFYDLGEYSREMSYRDGIYALVMTQDNFIQIYDSLTSPSKYIDRLLINIGKNVDQTEFANKIQKELGIGVRTVDEMEETLLEYQFPFYSVLVAEFIFAIIICIAAIAFTSFSNPLKILQNRITKHDVLKKIGVPTLYIIGVAALEILLACIIPGLVLGGAAGYGFVKLLDFLLIRSFASQAGLPYIMQYPPIAMILIFVGIPILFYILFYISMKANFFKYRPRNLE